MVKDFEDDIPPWKERHNVLHKLLRHIGVFGKKWIGLLVGKNKETGADVLRLYRFRNYLSINSPAEVAVVKSLLDDGSRLLGWDVSVPSTDALRKLLSENDQLKTTKNKTKEQLKRQREINLQLGQQVGQLREQQLISAIDVFKQDLEEFEGMLGSETKETEIQDWLYAHQWLFGPEYIDGSKQELTRTGDKIDFLLQRYDTFNDVFELKLPTAKLFVGVHDEKMAQQEVGRTFTYSAEVKDGIAQLMGYLENYSIDKTNLAWEKQINVHKPKGTLIIGRTEKTALRALRTVNSYLHGIEILTYDDLLGRGKNWIKLLERKYSFSSKRIKIRKTKIQ